MEFQVGSSQLGLGSSWVKSIGIEVKLGQVIGSRVKLVQAIGSRSSWYKLLEFKSSFIFEESGFKFEFKLSSPSHFQLSRTTSLCWVPGVSAFLIVEGSISHPKYQIVCCN